MTQVEWTEEWPKEPGDYYYFGDFKGHGYKPRLQIVHVKTNATSVFYISGGLFLYPSEQRGMFSTKPVDINLPDLKWAETDA